MGGCCIPLHLSHQIASRRLSPAPAWGTPELIPMQTDYTAAIIGVTALVILLTAMTVFVLSRPSDLAPRNPR